LVDYNPTSGYRFEANPTYFAGAPRVRELIMPVIDDPSATFTALRSGEIDAAARPLSPELIDQFSGSNQVGVVKTAPLQFPELRMNFEHAPFDQPALRRAMSRALDRHQMLETVFLGQGRPAVKGYPHPDAPFANPMLSTPYAPDEARQLLDQAGFVDRDGDGIREGPNGPPALPVIRHRQPARRRPRRRAGRRGSARGGHRVRGHRHGRGHGGEPVHHP
jgi:peptide/nickel transport system substrate-binding protein